MNYTTWRDIREYLHVNSGSINLSSIMIKQISYLCEFYSRKHTHCDILRQISITNLTDLKGVTTRAFWIVR